MNFPTRYENHEWGKTYKIVFADLTSCVRCGLLRVTREGHASYVTRALWQEGGIKPETHACPPCIAHPKGPVRPKKTPVLQSQDLPREDEEEIW
jgi:hypothetical protein